MKRHIFIFMVAALVRFAMPAQNTISTMESKFVISANGKELTASFADNSSAAAFRDLISDAPLIVEMDDYGDFEKVGSLGHDLPTNDTRITTRPGDVILYLGSNITIYYDVNTWTFTRLGEIDGNPTRGSILSVLGSGKVNVTFSLKGAQAGIAETDADSSALRVNLSGRVLAVDGISDHVELSVYNLEGKIIYKGTGREITLPGPGIYMVTSGNAKVKVMVK